jgi:pSer/pThr/pTyr-binding forkhead associated (FHA) protein
MDITLQIVFKEGPLAGSSFALDKAELILGRDPAADILIGNPDVSRRHARLVRKDEGYQLEDLGSSNGTFVNGTQISSPVLLKNGDEVRLGPGAMFIYLQPRVEQATTTSAPVDQPPTRAGQPQAESETRAGVPPGQRPPAPRLTLVIRGGEPRIYPLTQKEITFGRVTENAIVVESPDISRRHARLVQAEGGYRLEDLGSSNGTFVNGERISAPRLLRSGDQVRLGQSVEFLYEIPVPAGAPAERMATVVEKSGAREATVLGEDLAEVLPATPPTLTITVAGQKPVAFPLTQPAIRIGRAPDNDIVIDSRIVSRYHARLEQTPRGYQLVTLPEATNPILLEGRPLPVVHPLADGNLMRIGGEDPGMMVTLVYGQPMQALSLEMRPIRFGEKTLISIGRDPSNDVVLDSPTVSRFHAQIERVGHRYRLIDLRSANGTFVNDRRIDEKEYWLKEADTVRIGRHRFVMKQDQLDQYDETKGLKVEAVGLNKWVRKDLNILQNISLSFQPREFIVVVGQSGGGKSTLVEAILGSRPATHGQVLVNGTNVYKNYDAVRNDIGFVPQRDIIHTGLTVYQALDYSARLRMPRDTTKEERHKRIMEVLEDLDLLHRKDNPISKLSGGQIKRVSIGVELLTSPGLFFLDEPTSGLDPGTETAFMHLMRRLADQGRTIVMVTHATKNVMLADKVVFLARGGYLAWFGPPDEALAYFDTFRTEREQRARDMEFDQIYALLDDPSRGSAQEWARRFAESPAYQRYVVEALKNVAAQQQAAGAAQLTGETAPKPKTRRRISGLNQFFVLSARNIRILIRDKSSLTLMLAVPPLAAMLDFVIAPLMGRAPFDYYTGDAANGSITLFLMSLYCLLIAGLSQMREFVKEEDIYKRERLVNLKILPYVASKVWVALLLAFYHAAAYTIVHFLAFDMPGGATEFLLVYATMVLAAMAGMACGLLASALAPAASSAPMIMIMLLIPQIVLSGVLAPVPENISQIASTKWAFEGLIGIVGYGKDVAADACWQLPKDLRDAMTLKDKEVQGCRCMGVAIFKPGSCNFPGVGQFYTPEVDQPEIPKPEELGPRPPEPVIPPAPTPPADQNDQVEMVKYLNALDAYQDQVAVIQEDYKNQMALYESQANIYQAKMEDYQKAVLEYETARNSAVQKAEGVIDAVNTSFGWAFVDKDDPEVFQAWLIQSWGAQGIIIAVFLAIILVLIKRKDAR